MSRNPLTRNQIVEAALELVQSEGVARLSMRKLGQQLGVEAMSLYHHVKDKDDLLDALHEHLLQKLEWPPPSQDAWWQQAAEVARRFRNLLSTYPGAIPLFASRSAIAPGSLRLVEGSVQLLLQAGFAPDQALFAFQNLFCFTLGHAIFHDAPRSQSSYARGEDYRSHEGLAQVGDPSRLSSQAEFEFGLENLLQGLRLRLDRP